MAKLWLLKGDYDAAGWRDLEKDAKAKTIEVVLFDRLAWALILAEEAPQGYEGLPPTPPPDGLYVDGNGVPVYVVDAQEVTGPLEVIAVLGEEAQELLRTLKDPDRVLDRLGRAY